MIIEGICNVIWSALSFIISLLPTVDITIPSGFIDWILNIFNAVAYFLPIGDFLLMLGIWFFAVNFHIIWKTIQRVWDALPFT